MSKVQKLQQGSRFRGPTALFECVINLYFYEFPPEPRVNNGQQMEFMGLSLNPRYQS